jgi:uncharacterized protein YndB with AHSA1/START domain
LGRYCLANPDQDEVVVETTIAAPPERVFEALTDQKQLLQWWDTEATPIESYEIEPRLGGRYRYAGRQASKDVNGVSRFECHGVITEFDPPRVLAHTWIANWHEDKLHPTLVRYELIPEGEGTRLKVTHSGLANEPVARKDYSQGWVEVLGLLKTFIEKR